jgi:hypothetical protein
MTTSLIPQPAFPLHIRPFLHYSRGNFGLIEALVAGYEVTSRLGGASQVDVVRLMTVRMASAA